MVNGARELAGFSKRLRTRLESTGIRPAEVARSAGLSRAAVNYMKNGLAKSVSSANLYAIADCLHCNPRWLATGVGPEEAEEIVIGPARQALIDSVKGMDEEQILLLAAIVAAGGCNAVIMRAPLMEDGSGQEKPSLAGPIRTAKTEDRQSI